MDDWRALNRANWDERVAVHLAPGGYDLTSFRAGTRTLGAIVEAELPAVTGQRVLHLQCHFGLDTLVLAQRGADVTGLDFSPAGIAAARHLAAGMGLAARFVCADLYDAPAALPEPASFDLVYVTWGALCWLPDIAGWGRVVHHFLKPGGALYLAESHPLAHVFDNDGTGGGDGKPGWWSPYLGRAPIPYDDSRDYASDTPIVGNTRQVNWLHPLADTLGALRSAGMQLDWLHEHPRVAWQMFEVLRRDDEGMWGWPDRPWLPLAFSLRAVRLS